MVHKSMEIVPKFCKDCNRAIGCQISLDEAGDDILGQYCAECDLANLWACPIGVGDKVDYCRCGTECPTGHCESLCLCCTCNSIA